MKLCVITLKEEEKFDTLMKELSKERFEKMTAFNSNSYITEKGKKGRKNTNIFASIKYMIDYYNDESKTIFVPCTSEKTQKVKEIIKSLLTKEQYVLLILDIEYYEGI